MQAEPTMWQYRFRNHFKMGILYSRSNNWRIYHVNCPFLWMLSTSLKAPNEITMPDH